MLKFDTNRVLEQYSAAFPGKLAPGTLDNLWPLLDLLNADEAMADLRWVAYALATARHETGSDFRCRSEVGVLSYFDKYEPTRSLGVGLGNTITGDGFRYRGRGYVQLTGRANYDKFSPLVDVDLITNPDAALLRPVAYKVLSIGMTEGKFTGRKLADYIHGVTCNYINARRIVNGTDRAELIAGYAEKFQALLERCAIAPSIPPPLEGTKIIT